MIIWFSITSAELRFNYKHKRGFGTVLFTLYLKVRCYRDRYVLCTAVHCCKNALNAQCSKWYEISDMEIFQITEENPDPPTNQGAYFNILLSI